MFGAGCVNAYEFRSVRKRPIEGEIELMHPTGAEARRFIGLCGTTEVVP
jgi:hypothetical protein